MKNLKTPLITLMCAIACLLLTIGLLTSKYSVILVIALVLFSAGIYLLTYVIIDTVELITAIKKKKKKTNETNKIKVKLKVRYKLREYPTLTYTETFVSERNLMYCVREAIIYAKAHDYIILEMYQLTVED